MSHFFVSYSHQDIKFVDELTEKAAEAGLLLWTDNKIKIGQQWRITIDTAIQESDGVIVVITQDSLTS